MGYEFDPYNRREGEPRLSSGKPGFSVQNPDILLSKDFSFKTNMGLMILLISLPVCWV